MTRPKSRRFLTALFFVPACFLATPPAKGAPDIVIKTYPDTLGYKIALTTQDAPVGGNQFLFAGDTSYYIVAWDITGSPAVAANTFTNRWYLDGDLIHQSSNPADPGFSDILQTACCPPAPPLSAGSHTVQVFLDYFGEVAETNEVNNSATRRFLVFGTDGVDIAPLDAANPQINLGWSDGMVISDKPNTNTDAASIDSTQTIYVDAIAMNFGPAESTNSFVTRLKLDGNVVPDSTRTVLPGLAQQQASITDDAQIGPLAPGQYTLTYEIDPLGAQPEQNETNNSYSRTFIVSPVTPVITSSLSRSGTRGTPFDYTITANNFPTIFTAVGLPSGLGINPTTGLISGTPTTNGRFDVTITAINAAGADIETLTLDIAAALPVVTNTNSSGPGSLRDVVAGVASGANVTFANSLNNGTINLGGSEILIDKNLTIDGSALTGGITISGANASRVFSVASARVVILRGLTISAGNGNTSTGGGVFSQGNLTLNRCTLTGNSSSGAGGAIFNQAGALLTLVNCTLTGNSSSMEGGAILNNAPNLTLTHCTLSGNTANGYSLGTGSAGGGIFSYSTLTLDNTIISGNSATLGSDIAIFGSSNVTRVGSNLVQSISRGNLVGTGSISDAKPQLAPLGNYGGPAPVMPPLPGSPSIEAGIASGSTPATDQLGHPRPSGALPDIGAVEALPLGGIGLASADGDTIPDILEGPDTAYPHLDPLRDDSTIDSDADG
ncbi:MAG: choice-of-anchor Q domain-containing protein, partial [Verrucomicrobiales bacterium]|nr:choice-of-anchor Q domain-containing protein [Verrucomicrobiales bacterium]